MKQRLIFLLVSLSSIPFFFNNCSKAEFKTSEQLSAAGYRVYQTEVTLSLLSTRPVDLIWVIDNSGSMALEASHVRSNIQAFAQSISSAADARLALLSQVGTSGTAVTLPAISIPTLQIPYTVQSQNGLEILSGALCVGATTARCAQTRFSSYKTNSIIMNANIRSFLRADSQKVVVMVTDDESNLAESEFRALFADFFPSSSLTVFGFVGLGAVSPCQARTGSQYVTLASATGGGTYNICDANWSSNFSKLTNHVISISQDSVTLPQAVLQGKIYDVHLNGKKLEFGVDYTLTLTGLTLSASARAGLTSASLVVEYL